MAHTAAHSQTQDNYERVKLNDKFFQLPVSRLWLRAQASTTWGKVKRGGREGATGREGGATAALHCCVPPTGLQWRHSQCSGASPSFTKSKSKSMSKSKSPVAPLSVFRRQFALSGSKFHLRWIFGCLWVFLYLDIYVHPVTLVPVLMFSDQRKHCCFGCF